jgi:hypothetical protein
MTAALIPLLRKSDNPSVVVIASIAGLLNQRYVPFLSAARVSGKLTMDQGYGESDLWG